MFIFVFVVFLELHPFTLKAYNKGNNKHLMLYNNYQGGQKKSSSNKKVHRRVITEMEEPRHEPRKT